MLAVTRFITPTAVETWDAWFRWRVDGVLRDITVDDTWWRVADAVTAHDPAQAALWAHRYVDAFSHWRLLPDERLLRAAGTGVAFAIDGPPAAVINVAALVTASFGESPRLDAAALADTAALAVRVLDDALCTHAGMACDAGLRIGLIGFADALARLGIPYTGLEARELAATVGAALELGCLRGSVDLAEERGPRAAAPVRSTRCVPAGLQARMREAGLRHATLTSMGPHPLLARLANGVCDGMLPANPTDVPAADRAHLRLLDTVRPWIDHFDH